MTPRRCFDCGARAADGADVRECDGCTFKFCEEHAATVGGVTKCHDCKRLDRREAAMSEKMPESMTVEAVARMLYSDAPKCVLYEWRHAKEHARAVLALVAAKVREAVRVGRLNDHLPADAIVARVMGTEAKRGPEAEGREESPHA